MAELGIKTRRWIWAAIGITVIAVAGVAIYFALRGPTTADAFLAGYRTTDDPRVIVLVATVGPHDEVIRSEVREQPDKIVVAVKVPPRSDEPGNSSGVDRDVTVRLTEPLGDREIVTSEGKVLSEVPVPPKQ